jgi:diguanylate cyclase (GGDEF)-like protein
MMRKLLTLFLALAVFFFVIFPRPEGMYYDLVRGFIFVILVIVLYLYARPTEGAPQKKMTIPRTYAGFEEEGDLFQGEELRNQYDEFIDVVLGTAQGLGDHYAAAVFMIDPANEGYTLQKATRKDFAEFVPHDNPVLQSIVREDQALLLQQKDITEGWEALFTQRTWRGSECIIGVRIRYKNAPLGCLLLLTDHFSSIRENDRQIVFDLAKVITLGVEKLELIERLLDERYSCNRVINLINSMDLKTDEREVLQKIRAFCRSVFNYDKLTITMKGEETGVAAVRLVDGFQDDIGEGMSFSISDTLHGLPYREKQVICSSYWEQDFDEAGRFGPGDMDHYHFMSILAVPIIANEEVIGTIAMERMTSRGFTEANQALLELLSLMVGTVLNWHREYQTVHQSAIHDGLTGLLNHKAFMERFVEEVSRSTRYQHEFVLVMLDLDKFKRINDTYSHLYGDYVLKKVAQIIKSSVRAIDVVGRYGGEEFIILLVNTNKKASKPIADRIVENVANHHFHRDGVTVKMTISAGMSEFPNDSNVIKDLIAKADLAMYQVKAEGGNGVRIFQEETAANKEKP